MALDFMADDSITNRTFPSPPEGVSNVTIYVMGAEEPGAPGQYWASVPEWPAPTPTDYFLAPGGGLSTAAPGAGPQSTTYLYDPSDPVPTIGGNNLEIPCGPLDQRPLEKGRGDVLIFTTPPLSASVAVAGSLTVTLYVSTNVTDTDMVAKLIDVYPANSADAKMANSSTLVADGIVRMKWRKFPATNLPQPLSGNPADVYEVTVSLWNTTYVFAPGHRIRVHVSSSNFPRFSPNPNNGLPINQTGVNITAQTTLYFDASRPSRLTLPVVDAATQLPPFPVEDASKAMAARHEGGWAARREAALAAGAALPADHALPFWDWLSGRAERLGDAMRRRWARAAGAA
jgi:uncharacterized protein